MKRVCPAAMVRGLVFSLALIGCGGLAGGALPGSAQAATPNWPTGPYLYTVVNQDLRSVLERFAENMGTKLVLADGVKGTVQGTPANNSPQNFLDQLCRSYGLDWYYDGTVLAISTIAEEETQTVDLRGLQFDDAKRRLTAAGVLDPRYGFKPGTLQGSAFVSGPPRYVETVGREFGLEPEQQVSGDSQLVIHEGDRVTVYRGPNFLPQ